MMQSLKASHGRSKVSGFETDLDARIEMALLPTHGPRGKRNVINAYLAGKLMASAWAIAHRNDDDKAGSAKLQSQKTVHAFSYAITGGESPIAQRVQKIEETSWKSASKMKAFTKGLDFLNPVAAKVTLRSIVVATAKYIIFPNDFGDCRSQSSIFSPDRLRETNPLKLLRGLYAVLSALCFAMMQHFLFDMMVYVAIFCAVASAIMAASSNLTVNQNYFDQKIALCADPYNSEVYCEAFKIQREPTFDVDMVASVNFIAYVCFRIEFIVKVVAEGNSPFAYFYVKGIRSSGIRTWNCFDFFCLLTTEERLVEAIFQASNLSKGLSSLRVLRVLKLLHAKFTVAVVGLFVGSQSSTKTIIVALYAGLSSVTVIGPIWLLIIYIYAMIGFKLYAENDPDGFGTIILSMRTLFQLATYDGFKDTLYLNAYGCERWLDESGQPYCDHKLPQVNWANEDLDNGWQGGKGGGGGDPGYSQPQEGEFVAGEKHSRWNIAMGFFFSYAVLSSLVLLSAFLGIVQTAMDTAAELENDQNLENQTVAEFRTFKSKSKKDTQQLLLLEQAFFCMDLDGSGDLEPAELKICKDFAQHDVYGVERNEFESNTAWAEGIEAMFDNVVKQKQGRITRSVFLKAHFRRSGSGWSNCASSPNMDQREGKSVRIKVMKDLAHVAMGEQHLANDKANQERMSVSALAGKKDQDPISRAAGEGKSSVLEDVLADVLAGSARFGLRGGRAYAAEHGEGEEHVGNTSLSIAISEV
jgi:Ca2+-binding EF-hand superfamily protein